MQKILILNATDAVPGTINIVWSHLWPNDWS